MQVLNLIRSRFAPVLSLWLTDPVQLQSSLDRIVASREAHMADYQANVAMPLEKMLSQSSVAIAEQIVAQVQLSDVCDSVTIAGRGYINMKLSSAWLSNQLSVAHADDRLGVAGADSPKTFVVDFSSPNVAKPMHVGHIRSTVIGDAITKILRFLGHRVVTDNHLGDWGTQFGMIIYGYKHFRDDVAYVQAPVPELSRLYRLVHQLISYHETKEAIPKQERSIEAAIGRHAMAQQKATANPADKKAQKELTASANGLAQSHEELKELQTKFDSLSAQRMVVELALQHPNIEQSVQLETAKLHRGDVENQKLWDAFLPHCKAEIHAVYRRLHIQFDHEYGESYYHDMLPMVVEDLLGRSLAQTSDGAICVFLDGYDAPMIVQKQDGAYLYATTDIATAMFREREFEPDGVLYVVDHRQGEHFQKLFAVLKKIGLTHTEFKHVKFGTVLGKDGKPFKTRDGVAAGLESLIDESVQRAWEVVCNPERLARFGALLSEEEKRSIAEVVGIGAIKYADLAHNRTSDYKFDVDKMVRLDGNTAAYIQYSYARTRSILHNASAQGFDSQQWQQGTMTFDSELERGVGLQLIRFEDMLMQSMADHLPNLVTEYLFDLAKSFSSFYDQLDVLKAETEGLIYSRLKLTDFTGKTLRQGLALLGIDVVERM